MEKLKTWMGYDTQYNYKIKIAYVINGLSCLLALLFTYFYGFLAKFYIAVPGILLYLLSVLVVFWLLKKGHFKTGKMLILIGFMLQESSIVFLLFSHEMHFNLFYFIVAPITFFIFEFDDLAERVMSISFIALAGLLFTISEVMPPPNPMIIASPEITLLFRSVSAVSAIFTISVVFYFFAIENMKAQNELKHLANTDALTSIFNRRVFFNLGEFEFNLALKYQRKLSVILLDIDHFKNVNDTHGHQAGDAVLVALTSLIRNTVRKGDIFSRYGGEEFALVLRDADLEEAVTVAEKIRKAVGDHDFVIPSGESIHLTISAGVSHYESEVQSFEKMVLKADLNLYAAKNKGRNQVVS